MIGLFKIDVLSSNIIEYIVDKEDTEEFFSEIIENNNEETISKNTNLFYKIKDSNLVLISSEKLILNLDRVLLQQLPTSLEDSLKVILVRIGLFYYFWKEHGFLKFSPKYLTELFLFWFFEFNTEEFPLLDINTKFLHYELVKETREIYDLTLEIVEQKNYLIQNRYVSLINNFLDDDKNSSQQKFKEITVWLYINKIYLPEIYNLYIFDLHIMKDNVFYIKLSLNEIIRWQDWKLGMKYIENLMYKRDIDGALWFEFSKFSFTLGELTYNLFKSSNTGLIIYFFEKTLNFISRAKYNTEIYNLFFATSWYIGQIEFDRGYAIKSAEYQLNSFDGIYNTKDNLIPLSKDKIRNLFIMALYQGATDLFIASKVSSQTFQFDVAKNHLNRSLKYINKILKLFFEQEIEFLIGDQIKKLILQIHGLCDRENFLPDHKCDIDSFDQINNLNIEELYSNVSDHIDIINIEEDRIFWLTVIDKGGLTLFSYDFEGNSNHSKNTLYSSFIFAISRWGEKELASGPATELTFSDNTIIIEPLKDIDIIAVISKSSVETKSSIKLFANSFFKEYKNELNDWNGSTETFKSATQLIEKCFPKLVNN